MDKCNHVWGDPYFKWSDACDRAKKCKVCGVEQFISKEHDWGDWVSESPHVKVRTCRRSKCKAEERKSV